MIYLIFGLLVFLGVHSVRIFANDWRTKKILEIGDAKWKTIYTVISLISFVLIIYGYIQARQDVEIVYVPFNWGRSVAIILMLASFVLSTFNMRSSRLRKFTHHPFMVAIILWTVAHLLANGDMASVILFGSFLVWSSLALIAATRRGESIPPVAPLSQDIAASAVAIVIWAIFIMFAHNWLFGVSPIP